MKTKLIALMCLVVAGCKVTCPIANKPASPNIMPPNTKAITLQLRIDTAGNFWYYSPNYNWKPFPNK